MAKLKDPERPLGREYPPHLYKYRCLDIRTLSALAKHCLYCLDFKLFNDPFDCQVGYRLDDIIRVSHERGLKNEFTGLDTFRICALTEARDDILMWAHYADNHTGLCLEFSLEHPASFRQKAWPVEYQSDYPDLLKQHSELEGPHGSALLKLLLTKSDHWNYEREWRLMMHVSGDKANIPVAEFLYAKEVLSGVIFGMRAHSDSIALVRSVLRGMDHISYYQARKNGKGYALDIVEL